MNLVSIVMGSKSDWETMTYAAETLSQLGVPYEIRIISAHRTPDLLFSYAENAYVSGIEVLIAGAGGAAHLPGMLAAKTHLPVVGVPSSSTLSGFDSLLSISQMPSGIPVATMAIGKAGAINAALFATSVLCGKHPEFIKAIQKYRSDQTDKVYLMNKEFNESLLDK